MKSINKNIRKDIPCALIVVVIGILALCLCEKEISVKTAISYNIEMWIDGCDILDFFFPLFVSFPFTWRMYFERKDGFINYVAVRTDQRKYIVRKIFSGMTASFLMTFIIYYVGLMFAILYLNPDMRLPNERLLGYLFGSIQAEKPLLFGIFWCMWKGFIASLICAFGYGISLVADNLFVIAIAPFLYCIIENFITGTLGIEQYSICTSYILDRLSPKAMGISNYFIGIVTFVILGSCIILAMSCYGNRVHKNPTLQDNA